MAQNHYSDDIQLARNNGSGPGQHQSIPWGSPPPYKIDREDTLAPYWWDMREWSWKKFMLLGVGIAIVIIILVVAIVEVEKENAYPDYSPLNYTLLDTYSGTDFFDNFDYFTATDPSDGFVQYVDAAEASELNLTYASSTSAILRVDTSTTTNSNPNSLTPRSSVRITSKTTYATGLFIFDVIHTPYQCGTWPALWLTDPSNWPEHGEIDVMEAVNQADTGNQMTLHTSADCSMKVKRKETGEQLYTSCVNTTNDNAGCGVKAKPASFGSAFNAVGGGIMAMELRAAGIRMWQFYRDAIPDDITAGSPDPSTWGEALADFPGTDCDISTHFLNQSIIANIDLCGSWAGATSVYNTEDSCPSTCEDQVANNATSFADAYWEFGGFTVYHATN